jgi:predicted dehydrogenase
MSDAVRFGIIGTGKMADNILPDFPLAHGVEASAILSRTAERAEESARQWGIGKAYHQYEAMLADDDLDAIYVASPHPMHLEYTVRALEAGKHVLVEKPAGMNAAEARTLHEVAQRHDRFLAEAMWMTFQPSTREVLRRIADGVIGDVRHVHADLGRPFAFDPSSRMWNRVLGASAVLDMGVYPLSFIHAVLGVPDEISAIGTLAETGVDAEATMILGFPGGRQASAVTSMRAALPAMAVVSGTQGLIRVHDPIQNSTRITIDRTKGDAISSPEELRFVSPGNGYVTMLEEVGTAILDGRREHPHRTWAQTVEVQEIMDRVLEQINPT